MTKYDDASWHYEGDYPTDLPEENAAIHIGLFLTWCIENDFISEELFEDEDESIAKVKAHEMTGAEFVWNILDGKLVSDDLNDKGNEFAADYYEDDTKFSKIHSNYITDLCNIFDEKVKGKGFEYESVYHVEDTWENYMLIKKIIDTRFEQWQELKSNT